jgi:hypothetical protein
LPRGPTPASAIEIHLYFKSVSAHHLILVNNASTQISFSGRVVPRGFCIAGELARFSPNYQFLFGLQLARCPCDAQFRTIDMWYKTRQNGTPREFLQHPYTSVNARHRCVPPAPPGPVSAAGPVKNPRARSSAPAGTGKRTIVARDVSSRLCRGSTHYSCQSKCFCCS